jgi:hypothetical protein
MLLDASILQPVNMYFGPGDPFVCGLFTHHGAFVGRYSGTALHDSIAGGNEIFFRHDDIGKGAIHHAPDLLESFESRMYGGSKVMDEILGVEQTVDPVHVMVIFEDPGEFPNGPLVLRFVHVDPPNATVIDLDTSVIGNKPRRTAPPVVNLHNHCFAVNFGKFMDSDFARA